MIFFIATIFIAQLIIVGHIVFFIISADNKVNLLITKFDDYSLVLEDLMQIAKEISEDTKTLTVLYKDNIRKNSYKFVFNKSRNIIESLIVLLVKPRYKKIWVSIKLGLNLAKKLIKSKNMV